MIEDIKIGDTVWFREALLRSHKPQKAVVRGISKNGKYIMIESNRYLGIKDSKELYATQADAVKAGFPDGFNLF